MTTIYAQEKHFQTDPPPVAGRRGAAAACSKQSEPAAHDPHAGHNHGKAEASAPRPHKAALSGAKCAAHGAPKELCFICDASLRDKGRLWCDEHKRYEDRCLASAIPELQDKNRPWCKEHSLYEDECFLCRPELKGKGNGAQASGAVLMCSEHGVPEAECGICRPELAGKLKPGEVGQGSAGLQRLGRHRRRSDRDPDRGDDR